MCPQIHLFFLPLHLILKATNKKYNLRYFQIGVLFGIVFFIACGLSKKEEKSLHVIGDLLLPGKIEAVTDSICYTFFRGDYNTVFNDLHELHMSEATKQGFSPMVTRRDTSRMKGKIVYHKPGEYENFVVDSLPHSMPVMIPSVAKLINEIAVNFRDSLKLVDYPDHKILVTSITRTEEDIKQLRRINGNSISDSAHRFGTTFDISWLNFQRVDSLDRRMAYNSVLKKSLGKVLYNMQQRKKCYIKYEEQQMCFHITIRKND